MGKVAFVFSGQGAQYPGMGQELYEQIPACREVFDRLSDLRPDVMDLCFNGTKDSLAQTVNTQPCMYAVEMAAVEALKQAGVTCDMTAGFSLGELSALTYSEAVSLEDGFRLVCQRAQLMQDSSERTESGMAVILKLDTDRVHELCRKYEHVYPVNYNCPGQISVAGASDELADFCKDVKAAAGRGVPLSVGGAFHSPFMQDAANRFDEVLADTEISEPSIPLYSNVTAEPYSGDYKNLLSRQICNPVNWQGLVENMIADGADTFIEFGPGSTLCSLIKKINSSVKLYHVENCASLHETLEGLAVC